MVTMAALTHQQPGGLAKNPYRPSESEPYTGLVPVEDYIEDIQLAQMRILAKEYGTDLMWCDVSYPPHIKNL